MGAGAAVYVSWASLKAKPAGVLFASDLQLSRSLDGARSFERPLRVNEDRPMSHSFEGLAVGSDGTVVVGWIDAREGEGQTRSYLARIVDRGSRVEQAVKLDDGETCVCCRIDVAAGDGVVATLWRKVFPGNIRDMVLGLSRDGGRSFGPPARVASTAGRSRRARTVAARSPSTAAVAFTSRGTRRARTRRHASSTPRPRTAAPSTRPSASPSPPAPCPTTWGSP